MKIGKLPEPVLIRSVLKQVKHRREEVLVGPSVGQDCAALQVGPEEVLVFEDALYAIRTAAKAGFVTVGVEDPYNASDKEAIRETADYYIEELAEFPKFWEW